MPPGDCELFFSHSPRATVLTMRRVEFDLIQSLHSAGFDGLNIGKPLRCRTEA